MKTEYIQPPRQETTFQSGRGGIAYQWKTWSGFKNFVLASLVFIHLFILLLHSKRSLKRLLKELSQPDPYYESTRIGR